VEFRRFSVDNKEILWNILVKDHAGARSPGFLLESTHFEILVPLRRDQEMKYKAVPILIFLSIIPTFFSSAYAQPQIGEKTPGFITSTLEGKRIALKDYWEQQAKKVLVLSFLPTWCQPCRHNFG
jgi:hypothetical protein